MNIPEHLVKRAAAELMRDDPEYENGTYGPEDYEAMARAALEAVAADIWEQGHAACDRDWAFTGDLSTPDEDRKPWTNPYRAT